RGAHAFAATSSTRGWPTAAPPGSAAGHPFSRYLPWLALLSAAQFVLPFRFGKRSGKISRKSHAGHLPARLGNPKISVARPDVAPGRQARATAQDHPVRHELAVVLAERAGEGLEAGISKVGARGPLPDVADELGQAGGGRGGRQAAALEKRARGGATAGGDLPLHLGRQARAGPARVGIGLVEADVADRRRRV